MYEVENMEMDVWLLDKKSNKSHNLTQNPVYVFTAFEQDDAERFVVHFSPVGIEEEAIAANNFQIWTNSNTLNILNNQHLTGEVKVVDITGQQVAQYKLTGETKQEIVVNAKSGFYVVNIKYTGGNESMKVIIK